MKSQLRERLPRNLAIKDDYVNRDTLAAQHVAHRVGTVGCRRHKAAVIQHCNQHGQNVKVIVYHQDMCRQVAHLVALEVR
jgi:AmiR/NasT family two-component response regulator